MLFAWLGQFVLPRIWRTTYWVRIIDDHKEWWFRRPFWFVFGIGSGVVALSQILGTWDNAAPVSYIVGVLDFLIAFTIFVVFRAVGVLSVKTFRHKQNSVDYVRRFCPKEWSAVQEDVKLLKSVRDREGSARAGAEMSRFADELANTNLPHQIFGLFARRIIALIAVVPVYVSVGLMAMSDKPLEHSFIREPFTVQRALMHGMAMVRDATTTFLGGSNTEHPMTEGEGNSQPKATNVQPKPAPSNNAQNRPADTGPGSSNASDGGGKNGATTTVGKVEYPNRRTGIISRGLFWETCMFVGPLVYLFLILWFVPMQLGSLQQTVWRFGTPDPWVEFLRVSAGIEPAGAPAPLESGK
jgi:hypothetical protein